MADTGASSSRWRGLLPAAALAAVTAWTYAPVRHGGWLWDDNLYVTHNPLLRSAAGLKQIWLNPTGVNYFPVTATCQWLQWHLWQDRPLGYHLTNVALHLLSAFLLWRLLRRLGSEPAWIGAWLFALHPLAVESVAWISELKNTLSLPLLLLAMAAYVDYDDASGARPGPAGWSRPAGRYGLALLWFLAAMLSKSTVAMFPVVVLLYGWWRRGRLGPRDWRASAPFFAIALGLGLLTWQLEHRQIAILGFELNRGTFARLAGAGLAAVFYFCKAIFPLRPLPIYPSWRILPPAAVTLLPWGALGAVGTWLWARRTTRGSWFGLGWFFINLLPVLGLAGMAFLRIAPVSDHFAYLALVGLVGLAAAGMGSALRRTRAPVRGLVWLVAALAGAALASASHRYVGVFRNQDALWSYAEQHDPESWSVQFNRANSLRDDGRLPEAILHYRKALALQPAAAEIHENLSVALEQAGQVRGALAEGQEARRLQPGRPETHENLGVLLVDARQWPEAIAEFEQALRLRPDLAQAESNLGLALANAGRPGEAIGHLRRALELKPDMPEAEDAMGLALAQSNRLAEALPHYAAALRLRPGFARAQDNWGAALLAAGRPDEAITHLEAAVKLDPELLEAQNNLAVALAGTGRLAEAIGHYEQALRLQPGNVDAHYNLANALAQSGRMPEAVGEYELALRLAPGDPEIRRTLSGVLRLLGRTEEAARLESGR